MKNYLSLMVIVFLFIALPVWAAPPQEGKLAPAVQKQPSAANEKQISVIQAETSSAQEISPNYVIGPGDVLDIALWRDDALVRQVTVLADGNISFPLIGEVKAAGKTIAELKKEISAKLTEYVPEPVLTIEVKQPNSMIVYVIGRVNNQNRFPVSANINVLQALSIAGGPTVFARENKIKIIREENGKTIILPFRYKDVINGEHIEQNITLKRGDVVVVP